MTENEQALLEDQVAALSNTPFAASATLAIFEILFGGLDDLRANPEHMLERLNPRSVMEKSVYIMRQLEPIAMRD